MDHVPSERQHDADVVGGHDALKRLAIGAAAVVVALILAALGVWQLERRAWKHDLIARVEARIHASPAAFPWSGGDPRDVEYRRVRVTGLFDHAKETLVQALTERGAGWWVLTPLRTDAGVVLVNRGFVPDERRDPATRLAADMAAGPVAVTGLVRLSELGGGFLRRNDPAAGRWYSRDVAAIARTHGLRVAPYFIDADATPNPGGYPVGGLTVVRFRDTHLVYALTWFALAAFAAYGAWRVLRR